MSAAVNVTNGGSATAPANNLPGNGRTIASLVLDDRLGQTREVGNQATWSLSSCKPGICTTSSKFKYTTWDKTYKKSQNPCLKQFILTYLHIQDLE